jgi:prepilin-type N-terminal cleavage/methylation domain-containing protein
MKPQRKAAFSLVELMIAASIISILGMLGTPAIRTAANQTEAAATANDLRIFTESIEFYSSASGGYPETMIDSQMPAEIASYLPSAWTDGVYRWIYINSENLTYAYFYNLGLTTEQLVRIDAIIDDGNIATGDIRMALNGTGLFFIFNYNS